MTITTTRTLGQKAGKPGAAARPPILPKANAPFTLGQIRSAIPPRLFQHSLLVRVPLPFVPGPGAAGSSEGGFWRWLSLSLRFVSFFPPNRSETTKREGGSSAEVTCEWTQLTWSWWLGAEVVCLPGRRRAGERGLHCSHPLPRRPDSGQHTSQLGLLAGVLVLPRPHVDRSLGSCPRVRPWWLRGLRARERCRGFHLP